MNNRPMLNAYPDSIGQNLGDMVEFLSRPALKDVFASFYILPSVFNTDLDRGFSVIDYNLSDTLAKPEDLTRLQQLGIDLKLDFILNHASVLSPQFQDLLKNGEQSKYKDFFINWNTFWEGNGTMTDEGYIQPNEEHLKKMFFRKPGLPILMVRMPDGKDIPYWNTFYQKVSYKRPTVQELMQIAGVQYGTACKLYDIVTAGLDADCKPSDMDFGAFSAHKNAVCDWLEGHREYLGQMDLNIRSELVWEFYDNTLKTLAQYGAKIVRLDAFAYAPKAVGEKNFLNEPGTWDVLERVCGLAQKYGLSLLPEIHASYGERIQETVCSKGYMTYDFFLPGLLIDALESGDCKYLKHWAQEILDKNLKVVNMLGCHDGIPLLDLKGLVPDERIERLIETVVSRGGYVKDLHGAKNMYYQVNATYYSALGENDAKMLLARAIQLFMPAKPQIWYLDLFCGKNDHEAVRRAGKDGHKEINRTNLTLEQVDAGLNDPVVQEQLKLLKLRASHPAFDPSADIQIDGQGSSFSIRWSTPQAWIALQCDLEHLTYEITEG